MAWFISPDEAVVLPGTAQTQVPTGPSKESIVDAVGIDTFIIILLKPNRGSSRPWIFSFLARLPSSKGETESRASRPRMSSASVLDEHPRQLPHKSHASEELLAGPAGGERPLSRPVRSLRPQVWKTTAGANILQQRACVQRTTKHEARSDNVSLLFPWLFYLYVRVWMRIVYASKRHTHDLACSAARVTDRHRRRTCLVLLADPLLCDVGETRTHASCTVAPARPYLGRMLRAAPGGIPSGVQTLPRYKHGSDLGVTITPLCRLGAQTDAQGCDTPTG